MVLGKLPVPGRPSDLADSRARAYCACSRCGWGCLDIFTLIYLFSPLSPSLWETARCRLKYCLNGPLNPKQPTNRQFWPKFYNWIDFIDCLELFAWKNTVEVFNHLEKKVCFLYEKWLQK